MLDPRKLAEKEREAKHDPQAAADAMAAANEMRDLKAELDELGEKQKELKARYDYLRKEHLPELMDEAGLVDARGKASLSLASGHSLYLSSDMHVNVRSSDRSKVYAWLKENGHGDLIVEYVHPSTLKAFTKEQLSAGREIGPIEAQPYLKAVLRKS